MATSEQTHPASGPESEFILRLEGLVEYGLIDHIDLAFAWTVCHRARAENDEALFLAALLASQAVNRRRQVCLDFALLPASLEAWLGADLGPETGDEVRRALAGLNWPEAWEERVVSHPAVAFPENAEWGRQLLVLENRRLYLQRYWSYERELVRMITARLTSGRLDFFDRVPALPELAPRFAGSAISGKDPRLNLQAAALAAGLRGRFTVISGGPGCGKTTVAAAICAGWLEARPESEIVLCAPTGLAQARLAQALRDEIGGLGCSAAARERLKELRAATIHRLLGYQPGRGFRYHAGRRLEVDLLIVDEASMVPFWIISSLLAALPEECAVILLGDRNQLASVEAGAVLGDICTLVAGNHFSPAFRADYQRLMGAKKGLTESGEDSPQEVSKNSGVSGISEVSGVSPLAIPLQDCVVELEKSWRFSPDGGIFRLQRAILAAVEDGGKALREILADDPSGEVRVRRVPAEGPAFEAFLIRELAAVQVEHQNSRLPLAEYARVEDPAAAFALFNSFRLLSPLRRGRFGVENLNRLAPQALGLEAGRKYYPGRPLMITRNDPGLNLFNGDIGLVRRDGKGRLLAWFAGPGGTFEKFSPVRLPAHESAFAVTVHKSQGSGFAHVVLVWPGRDNPLLTREMLYTAVTRAARKIEIWLPEGVGTEDLVTAAQRRVERPGGLRTRLEELEN